MKKLRWVTDWTPKLGRKLHRGEFVLQPDSTPWVCVRFSLEMKGLPAFPGTLVCLRRCYHSPDLVCWSLCCNSSAPSQPVFSLSAGLGSFPVADLDTLFVPLQAVPLQHCAVLFLHKSDGAGQNCYQVMQEDTFIFTFAFLSRLLS